MSERVLTNGDPVPEDGSRTEIEVSTGMQKAYVVLNAAERAKGYMKPYRDSYRHETCGTVTKMGTAIAETYARAPSFYTGTFCHCCRTHRPLNEFRWLDGEPMDTTLQEAWHKVQAAERRGKDMQRGAGDRLSAVLSASEGTKRAIVPPPLTPTENELLHDALSRIDKRLTAIEEFVNSERDTLRKTDER